MKKAGYAQQLRNIDRAAEKKGHIPSIVLMENAALSCVEELNKDFCELIKKRVAVFCGHGNNGGDGFAIAKHLYNIGVPVTVYLTCGREIKGDARVNLDIIEGMGVDIREIDEIDENAVRSYDIIIDAILGTGIKGAVRGSAAGIIENINKYSKYTLSIDVPSGMDSDTGKIGNVCVKADKTVTFAAYKTGMFMFPAADYCGKITVKGISIPQYIIDGENITVNVTDREFVRANLKKRDNNSQKGDYGKVLIIAASRGMTGAAYLATQAAMNSGSGLVTVGVPKSLSDIMEVKTTEAMTVALPDNDGALSLKAGDVIADMANRYDAVLIGPGLGRTEAIQEIVHMLLKTSRVPVVIDADGINAVSKNIKMLEEAVCPLIFTPHTVEMERLSGISREKIEEDRLGVSADFCEKYGASLLLKGHHTVVTASDKTQYINNTGNPGLATGGSGDVLAGILVSLAAMGVKADKAAAAAAYIHGTAGDIAADKYGMNSVTAPKILENISGALCRITEQ